MRALLACLFLAFPATAQEAPIQSTIERQLQAFQVDDFATAFTFGVIIIHRLLLLRWAEAHFSDSVREIDFKVHVT